MNLLLEYGADINAKDDLGITPLHLAWFVSIYFLLLKKKTEIIVSFFSGGINIEVIDFLLKNGADINAKSNDGYLIFWLCTDIIFFSKNCVVIFFQISIRTTPLLKAAKSGSVEVFQLLKKYLKSFDDTDKNDIHSLHVNRPTI